MSEGEKKTLLSFIIDSEGKLVGLLGDEDDSGCPVAFAPTVDLISALRLFLLQKAREEPDIVDERGIYQLMLERLDMGYAKLVDILEKEDQI